MSNLPQWRYVRSDARTGQWFGAPFAHGPWRPIPAPQPPERLFSMPATAPKQPGPTISDRLALAACGLSRFGDQCTVACSECRPRATAVAHEIAAILRERYGSSVDADWLDGVGCHRQGEGA